MLCTGANALFVLLGQFKDFIFITWWYHTTAHQEICSDQRQISYSFTYYSMRAVNHGSFFEWFVKYARLLISAYLWWNDFLSDWLATNHGVTIMVGLYFWWFFLLLVRIMREIGWCQIYVANNWCVTKFSCPAHINFPIFGNANIGSKSIMICQHEWFDAKIWHANIWQNAKCSLVIDWLPNISDNVTKIWRKNCNFEIS